MIEGCQGDAEYAQVVQPAVMKKEQPNRQAAQQVELRDIIRAATAKLWL